MNKDTLKVYGFGTQAKDKGLIPVMFNRKQAGKGEVAFKVTHCGVCHSDLHQVRNDWGNAQYPCVPGHEVVGTVTAIGEGVSKVKVGDIVGGGCMVDSCQECDYCEAGEENHCRRQYGEIPGIFPCLSRLQPPPVLSAPSCARSPNSRTATSSAAWDPPTRSLGSRLRRVLMKRSRITTP